MNSTDTESFLHPAFAFLAYALAVAQDIFFSIPGSAVVARYVKSSHQNDPGRTVLELILFAFAIRTLFQRRTRADSKNLIKLSEEEVDELVDEWKPEPLVEPIDAASQADLDAIPIISGPTGPKPKLLSTGKTVLNLASYNFAGLSGNEHIKDRAVETLRKYGLGSCGPPGFYGTIDVHMDLERDIAEFLGTEAAILYSQDFSTISSVIPAFCKRGDIIVADRGVNFAIQKGLQISRSTIKWYDHNDLKSLVEVLEGIEKDRRRKKAPLTRKFIVTEGIFQYDGVMVDLPKLIEIKNKYKYRIILDESISFGTVGRTGRGLTELYNVPASQIDMICGSVANSLCSSGGFCAGARHAVDHQRINGTSFVFSAAMPALLAVSASEGIKIFTQSPSIFATLQENIYAVRSVLDKVECASIVSHPASPIVHITIRHPAPSSLDPAAAADAMVKANPNSQAPAVMPAVDIAAEERLLQDVADECLANGVLVTRARHLRGQELVLTPPSIRLAVSSALTRKECEKAANVVKASLQKVLGGKKGSLRGLGALNLSM